MKYERAEMTQDMEDEDLLLVRMYQREPQREFDVHDIEELLGVEKRSPEVEIAINYNCDRKAIRHSACKYSLTMAGKNLAKVKLGEKIDPAEEDLKFKRDANTRAEKESFQNTILFLSQVD